VGDLTNPSPVLEIAMGIIGLVIVMIFHGTGIRFINRHYSAFWVRVDSATPHWRVNLLLALVITAFAIVHLVETLIWAVPIHRLGVIPNLRDAYYYVLESYTTLGEGAVSLPDPWRLIGPIIAMSGLFTFGWTGSVLVGIMTEYGQLDRSRARRAEKGKSDPGP
jgi:Ion channel